MVFSENIIMLYVIFVSHVLTENRFPLFLDMLKPEPCVWHHE